MGRGNIYYITMRPDVTMYFDEKNYYDRLDALGIDYVRNMSAAESKVPLNYLQETMKELNAVTFTPKPEGTHFIFGFHFDNVSEMKEQWFASKLNKLKEAVNNLELRNVVNCAPRLDYICNDDASDLVMLKDADGYEQELTMDDFIRQMEPVVTYYVYDKVILMH